MISDLLDEKIPTEESYEAIVRLWRMESRGTDNGKGSEGIKFSKEIGISPTTLSRAFNYIQDKEENPKAVEGISPGFWREIRTLPEEQRMKISLGDV